MDDMEKKVNAMIGKSSMNEYKAFKNLVKHKKRINRVFSEVCSNKSFRSRHPGIKKRAPAVAVASYSSEPSKTSRKSSSKKRKESDDGTPSVTVCPEKPNFSNPTSESISQLKVLQMLSFKLQQVSLGLAEKR
jgi:hypothetical protein